MKNQPFDEQLKQAANRVRQTMLTDISDFEEPHQFSAPFQEKLQMLMTEVAQHEQKKRKRRRVIAASLLICMGMSSWLAIDQPARAAAVQWVKTVYENSVLYLFFGESEASPSQYHLTWLPDGYVETERLADDTSLLLVYENGDLPLYFTCRRMEDSTQAQLFSNGNLTCETVQIQNLPGDFYVSSDPNETNELIWIDKDSGLLFSLSAYLSKSDMLKTAESVSKEK